MIVIQYFNIHEGWRVQELFRLQVPSTLEFHRTDPDTHKKHILTLIRQI